MAALRQAERLTPGPSSLIHCPRDGALLIRDVVVHYCLLCGHEVPIDGQKQPPPDCYTTWPPHANPRHERHTMPGLDPMWEGYASKGSAEEDSL
jgi:hypothetical protein